MLSNVFVMLLETLPNFLKIATRPWSYETVLHSHSDDTKKTRSYKLRGLVNQMDLIYQLMR